MSEDTTAIPTRCVKCGRECPDREIDGWFIIHGLGPLCPWCAQELAPDRVVWDEPRPREVVVVCRGCGRQYPVRAPRGAKTAVVVGDCDSGGTCRLIYLDADGQEIPAEGGPRPLTDEERSILESLAGTTEGDLIMRLLASERLIRAERDALAAEVERLKRR